MTKEEIINGIAFRIIEEYTKHPTLDWEHIAASKIYNSFVNEYGRQCFEAAREVDEGWYITHKGDKYDEYEDYLKELENDI